MRPAPGEKNNLAARLPCRFAPAKGAINRDDGFSDVADRWQVINSAPLRSQRLSNFGCFRGA